MEKKYFIWKVEYGKPYPQVWPESMCYDGQGKNLLKDVEQKYELTEKEYNLSLDILSRIYPYKEKVKTDE